MRKIAILIILTYLFILGNAYGGDNYTGTGSTVESQKWYGSGGYIELKNGKLHVGGVIYYPSKKSTNKWYGQGGYIKLRDGKLHTPNGTIYYPSKK